MTRKIPDYRMRVFLAVDLAGSTAFKSQQSSSSWIRVFRAFYANFLNNFQAIYIEFCEEHDECSKFKGSEFHPKVWKTVGDEIIFANRVQSQFHLFAYVHAFDQTLERYKEILKSKDDTKDLDVKGNGWVASFPYPNQTVRTYDPENGDSEDEISDEQYEKKADERPAEYDFLGPGIDAGFRIAANSEPGFLTLSPMFAWLLCRANTNRVFSKFKFNLEYRGTNNLKGVVDGSPYPIVGINTERDPTKKRIDLLRNKMLGGVSSDADMIIEYLELFANQHGVEMPTIKASESDSKFEIPHFYSDKFVPDWEKLRGELESRDENLTESAFEPVVGNKVERKEEELKAQLKAVLKHLRRSSDNEPD